MAPAVAEPAMKDKGRGNARNRGMAVVRMDAADIEDALATAVRVINSGGIVAYPTETFYGLGVRFDDYAALDRLHSLKKRPLSKAMPLIAGEPEALKMVAEDISPLAEKLMARFWPGPLTILFTARNGLPPYITANGKVAVRIPAPSLGLSLARRLGFPITATSANPSGQPPSSTPAQVSAYFDKAMDLLIDGGETPGGLPSTVVDATGPDLRIIRRGVIDPAMLKME